MVSPAPATDPSCGGCPAKPPTFPGVVGSGIRARLRDEREPRPGCPQVRHSLFRLIPFSSALGRLHYLASSRCGSVPWGAEPGRVVPMRWPGRPRPHVTVTWKPLAVEVGGKRHAARRSQRAPSADFLCPVVGDSLMVVSVSKASQEATPFFFGLAHTTRVVITAVTEKCATQGSRHEAHALRSAFAPK